MLFTTGCRRVTSIVIAIAAVLTLPACTVEAGDEAAHAIAEKFAVESTSQDPDVSSQQPNEAATEVAEAAPLADAQREADEAEMLARARAEAEARRKGEEESRVAEQAARKRAERAAEARRLAKERKRAEVARAAAKKAEAERRAQAQREADEAEMLARARAEAEERRRAEQRRLQAAEQERWRAARLAEEERQRAAAQAKRLAEIAAREEARKAEEARRIAEEERRKTAEYWRRFEEEQRRKAAEAKRRAEIAAEEEQRRAAEARRLATLRQLEEEGRRKAEQAEAIAALAAAEEARKAQSARRARESQQLSDRLKQIREPREQQGDSHSSPHALGGPLPRKAAPPDRKPAHSSRVTMLLVMDPGQRGIRRFNPTADPILCVGTRCYISEGPDEPARAMTRRGAFGPIVALGTRAGRCRSSLTCVFRAVDLERTMAVVQPIDLRILRHDRREPRAAAADPTCRIEGERLTCSRPIVASDYKLWVVPESTAERAGAFALELAVRAGLPDGAGFAHAEFDRR